MASRRSSDNAKRRYGTGSGRTTETGLFDLRDTGETPSGDQRPYRERHRVEVTDGGGQGRNRTSPSSAVRPDGRQIETDLFDWNGGTGTGRSYGDGSYYGNSARKLVRGNAPGRHQNADRGNEIRSGRHEIETDLLSRPAQNDRSRSGKGINIPRSSTGRSSSSTGMERARPQHAERGGRAGNGAGRQRRSEAPETQGPGGDRARRREAARKERERQLRSLYIRIGAGAALVLLLIILVPVAVHVLWRDKGSPAAGEATLAQNQISPGQDETEQEDSKIPQGAEDASGGRPAGMAGASGGDTETDLGTQEEAAGLKIGTLTDSPGGVDGNEDTGAGAEGADTPDHSDQAENTGSTEDIEDAENTENIEDAENTENIEDTENTENREDSENTEDSEPASEGKTDSSGGMSVEKKYARQDEWNLIVVNPWKEIPEDYTFETTPLPNGESVDSRCYSALVSMLDACRAAGNVPVVCSAYRTHEKQVGLFEDQVAREMAKGLSREEAEIEAATTVARPLTSEHELGLAADICDEKYQNLDDAQADTDVQKWLMQHCWEYGFVLRFPVEKGDITGIIFEPWHYRYVGREAAGEMYNGGNWICLEEYLAM